MTGQGGDELALVTQEDRQAIHAKLDELLEVLTALIPVGGVSVGVSLGSRSWSVVAEPRAAGGPGRCQCTTKVHAVRSAASICAAPRWWVREHGPAALVHQGWTNGDQLYVVPNCGSCCRTGQC